MIFSRYITSKWFPGRTDSIRVLGGHDFIHISYVKVQLSSVAHCMYFKVDQTEPKLFKFSLIFSRYTTPKWFSGQINSICVLRRLETQLISPTKTQLSSVSRRIDFKKDRNKPEFLSRSPPQISSRTNELKVFGRLESTHLYEKHVLDAITSIWQQLQMVFSHPPLGP